MLLSWRDLALELAGAGDSASAAALPGATIAQQAGAAGAKAGKGHGAPKKVATALGSEHYKLPIGALIIPHEHFIKGQPSHWSPNISQLKWVQNQWPDQAKSDQAAHAGVEAGTHRWVQAGNHEFAVHKGVEVHVPKSTDLGSETAVKNAPKLFVHQGHHPEHILAGSTVHDKATTEPVEHGPQAAHSTAGGWKPLHLPEKPQKSVTFGGQHAAWVPHDWAIYKSANAPEKYSAKWAADSEGGWHYISPGGKVSDYDITYGGGPEDWLKSGDLVKDDSEPAADHGLAPLKEGVQPAKKEVGGVAVTKKEMQQALSILQNDKSTAVKQPLAKAGHPLAGMAYHDVAKAELAKHPELKVSPGTKKAHVGQVKLAVMHHLSKRIQELGNDEAEAEAAQDAEQKAKDTADHAQELTPHQIEVPSHEFKEPEAKTDELVSPEQAGTVKVTGITASKEDVQAAIDALYASKSTAIKQVLKAKGNVLADADYWAVIHDYEGTHPNTAKGHGTKQAHVGNAKTMFIAALQEKLDGLKKADQATGHDAAAELYDLAKNGTLKPNVSTQVYEIAKAAQKAVQKDHNYYVYMYNGTWITSVVNPGESLYYKVTPELKLTGYSPNFSDGKDAGTLLWNAVHLWIEPAQPQDETDKALQGLKDKLTSLPKPEPEAKALSDVIADAKLGAKWENDPQWDDLNAKIVALDQNTSLLYPLTTTEDVKKKLAWLLWKTHATQESLYMTSLDGHYAATHHAPAEGSYAANASAWWEVKPDHRVIFHNPDGTVQQLDMASVQDIIKVGTKAPNQLLDSPPADGTLKVGATVYHMKPGDAVFKHSPQTYYVRHSDGSWILVDQHDVSASGPGNYKTLDSWATGAGDNALEAINDAAKEFQGEVPSAPAPKTEPGPDVKVYIAGKHAVDFPAGTKVYYAKEGPVSVKYAKTPDGQWHWVFPDHSEAAGAVASTWDHVVAGSGSYVLEQYAPNGLPSAPPFPPTPTAGIPAIYNGEIVGEWPAGTVLYHKPMGYSGIYGRTPDGKWWQVSQSGVTTAPNYKISDDVFNVNNAVEKEEPPTAEQVVQAKAVTELKGLIKNGSVDPAKAVTGTNGKVFKTWQLAAVDKMAKKKDITGYGSDVTIVPADKGYQDGWVKNSSDEHWVIHPTTMTAQYWAQGASQPQDIPTAQLLEAGKRYLVKDTVIVHGKLHQFGWWKKPKGSAYLQITAVSGYPDVYKYGESAHATYTYYSADGAKKEVTPAFAAKYLENAEHVAEEPKPGLKQTPPEKVTHAQLAVPGTYKIFSSSAKGPAEDDWVELKADGSGIITGKDAVSAGTMSNLIKGGTILDQYGNSIVRPGTEMKAYHVFGGAAKTAEELNGFKEFLEDNWNVSSNWPQEFANLLNDDEHQGSGYSAFKNKELVKAFTVAKNNDAPVISGTAQRNTIYQLVKELLAVPRLPEGAKVGATVTEKPKEIAYLKTMPPGIKKAGDIFTFTQDGWALPYEGQVPSPAGMTVPEMKDAISKISQQFGDGKVVGTHLTLPKYSLSDWLTGWKKGDMAAVFEIDSSAGKVSPAHPGAPANDATHHITWSPADPLQVPASKDVEGAWTDLKYGDVPVKEADNYLIKMHFQHGEYLQPSERQAVVRAHRTHDQDWVDMLTRAARQRFDSGPLTWHTAPLEWTDGLKPAKPYDSWLQNQTPAEEWPTDASNAFVTDHQAELEPYAGQAASETGYSKEAVLSPSGSYWLHEKLIQLWIDDAHAKEVAKQMVPVWKKVDTGQLPSHGHEVWKAVREIPYTGEQTTWFVKPAPDGKVFRLEQEHAANRLGKLFGFKTADSQLLDGEKAFGGQLVQVQKAVPGEPLGHYTDMPAWSDFTPQQIADMATEHLLDWVLANDDTSANNMIRTPDGHLVGIDKGRSWGNMDWQGLAGNSAMDSMTQLVYTKLYDAIRSGEISKDVADQAYIAVIQRARKMAHVPKASVVSILEDGFAHRTKWGSFENKQNLIDEVVKRQQSLEADFHQMWSKLYEDAGFGSEPSDFGEGKPWGAAPVTNPRYGMVVFNDKGQVFLREAKGHYNGSAWTFGKGGQDAGESPLQAATREVAEEMKYKFTPVSYVPGQYKGSSTTAYYYLATAKDAQFVPKMDNGETEQTRWVSVEEAHKLIDTSESEEVRARDHAVLNAAVKEWGSGKYDAEALADPRDLPSPLPDVPVQRLPDDLGGHTLYAGFSEPGFMEYAAASKSHGVPAFFGGPDLRDMHVLVWNQKDATGTDTTYGETFLKGHGYDKVMDWLKQAAGKETSHSYNDKQVTYSTGDGLPGRAPDSSPDRGGIDGERKFYNAIIAAARTVSRHKSDGKYNADTLERMDATEEDMQKLVTGADAVLSQGKLQGNVLEQMNNIKDMASQYMSLIAQVRKAKEGAYGFTENELPRWLPVSSEPKEEAKTELQKLGITVTYGNNSYHPIGAINPDNGEFEPKTGGTHTDPGNWYLVTLPGGEKIEIGNGNASSVQLVHHGRVRFFTKDHTAASLENVRSALQMMGLEMREAETRDFETFYWRHLLAMLDDRKDGHHGQQQKVWDELKNQMTDRGLKWGYGNGDGYHRQIIDALQALGENDPEGETDAYRHAFAKLTSEAQVNDWAERGGFLPHVKHFDVTNPAATGGKPDWYRFDLADKLKNQQLPMPIRQTSSGSTTAADRTIKSGGTYGKDALMRVAGMEADGMSNPYTSGGPSYVFTRLNIPDDRSTMWTPLALARSHNYSFEDDSYGEWGQRKDGAAWDSKMWAKYSGGSNETMIMDAMSVLDDLELVNAGGENTRQALINYLKDHGITHIRYMPVEDRILPYITSAAIAKVKQNWKDHPELLDPLAEPGVYTGLPGPAQTAAEKAAETAASDTEPAAQAADSGSITDPHLKFIVDFMKSHDSGDVNIYQPDANPGMYYVKFLEGNVWYSYEVGDDGSLTGPTAEELPGLVAQLNNGTGLHQVWPAPAEEPAAPKTPAQLLDQVMNLPGTAKQDVTSVDGTTYSIPAHWEAYKGGTTVGAVWARDAEGNWWKFNNGKSTPLLVAQAGKPMADDYQTWTEDGTFVPAGQ